jgi:hypothetical protein
MSYSRRQLYALGETFGESATRREAGGKIIYGSGGGGGGTPEKQTQIVDIPDWAKPYAKDSLARAAALTDSPYQAYGGERIAQFTPLQKQAFGRAGEQQVAGQIGTGTGLASLAGSSSFNDPGTASSFMSPYMQQVVDQQMSSAQRQADIAGTQRGAQAVRAGAFGGSRQAIENAEANRALASQKGEIQAKGLQSAFERAQQQFNQEQATRLSAAGQLGQLGQQQFGQEMGITGQQQQFGGIQRQATQDILSQQYQDFQNQQRAPYDQLSFMNSMIRGTPMGQTTTMYSPPASQFSQLAGLGIAGAGAYGAYQGAQNRAAGGEVKGYAVGGIASLNQPELASMAGGMSDEQLQRTQGLPSITEIAELTLENEAKQRALRRQQATAQQAMMQQQPQTTVAEERMAMLNRGIGGLEVPDNLVIGDDDGGDEYTAAGGGIVAFAPGGDVDLEKQREEDRARLKSMYEAGRISLEEFGRAIADIAALPLRGVAGAYDSAVVRPMRAAGLDAGYLSPYLVPEGVDPESMTPFSDQMRSRAPVAPAAPATSGTARDNRALLNQADAGIRSLPALTDAEKAARAAVTTKPPAPSAAPGAAPRNTGFGAAPATPSGGIADIFKDIKTRETQLRGEAKQASDIEAAGMAKERTALEAAKEEAKKYGTEQEEKYKKRGERLDKSEKGNIYQTMMEAGFAIAAGDSPNALKNLAVGAQQGLKGYQARLEKVNEGRDGLEDAMFKLYNIRNDKVTAAGDKLRELGRAETKARADAVRSLSEISKGMFGEEIKLKTKQADQIFEMGMTRFKEGQANARAKMTADRGDPILRRTAYQGLQKELENNQRLLMAYSKNPEKAEAARQEIQRIKGEMEALMPSGGGKVAGSSTLPPGYVPDK